jgi:hypothetical protein
MKVIILTITVLMLVVGLTEAGQGEVCYSSSIPVTQDNPLTNETRFACASLGEVTIPEIYLAGWRVAHLSNLIVVNDPTNPLNSQTAWMILIEMP